MAIEFRRRTLLPLDDVLGYLRDTTPKLTRSALHRCLERHGSSRLPDDPDKGTPRQTSSNSIPVTSLQDQTSRQ